MLKLGTFLRLKPLEQKHKLKEDYFRISMPSPQAERQAWSETAKGAKSLISIHDPLKRSKDQFEFKFDRVYTQDVSNVSLLRVLIHPATLVFQERAGPSGLRTKPSRFMLPLFILRAQGGRQELHDQRPEQLPAAAQHHRPASGPVRRLTRPHYAHCQSYLTARQSSSIDRCLLRLGDGKHQRFA